MHTVARLTRYGIDRFPVRAVFGYHEHAVAAAVFVPHARAVADRRDIVDLAEIRLHPAVGNAVEEAAAVAVKHLVIAGINSFAPRVGAGKHGAAQVDLVCALGLPAHAVDQIGRDRIGRERHIELIALQRGRADIRPAFGIAGADTLCRRTDLREAGEVKGIIRIAAAQIERDNDDSAVFLIECRHAAVRGIEHDHAGADIPRKLPECVIFLREDDLVLIVIRDGHTPESGVDVRHTGILVAVVADRTDMVVDQLPEDPCGGIQAVAVCGDALRQPECALHVAGIRTGGALSVHLAHPEVLALGKCQILELAALAAAVGMRINAGDRLLGFGREHLVGVDL